MPSGYTAGVADGEVTDLRTFALTCARGMGALVMMRDDPIDAPLPERFEPQTAIYDDEIERAKADLERATATTPEQAEECAQEAFENARLARADRLLKQKRKRARYTIMIRQVESWETEAEGLREFMLRQLYESMDCDCSESIPETPRMTGRDWRSAAISDAAQRLNRATKNRDDEIARTEDRNRWLAALRASLPEAS